jgi:nitroreductase
MLVPQAYRDIVYESELIIDLQREGNLDEEYRMQLLRKYIHMIDKGLQRDDSEPGHSNEIYMKCLDILGGFEHDDTQTDSSAVWAQDKLLEYEQFQSVGIVSRTAESTWLEHDRLIQGIRTRRSIRTFREDSVDVETVTKVVEPVAWSPSSCNRQPTKVFATVESDLVQRCLSTCKGATGFSTYVPAFLCFCADRRSYSLPREIWLPVLDTALGIQNCALVAHSLGLSLTLLSWAAHSSRDDANLRSILDIPQYYQIIVNAALGYPKRGVSTPLRKPIEQTLVIRRTERGGL